MRLFNLLKNICVKLNIVSDFVIEQGKSGAWTYRKWNSGIAECWGWHDLSNVSLTAWNSSYYYTWTNGVQFPSGLFNATPSLNITCSVMFGYMSLYGLTATGGQVRVYSPSNGSHDWGYYGYAVGTWKTPTLGGGYYLVGFLKGGVGYALIHLAERHYSLYPFGKEFTYRWKHARRWIHSISEWNEGVLGNSLGTKVRRHCDSSCILYLWKSYCTPALQYRNNDEVYFCWKSNVWQAIYCYSLRCSYHSSVYFNYIGNKLCYGRILIPGGDSYAAI